MIRASAAAAIMALLTWSCTKAPTQPTVGGDAAVDQFTLALEAQGSVPYNFAITQTTNVALTMASVVDSLGQVSKTTLGFALGTASADALTCTPLTTVNATPSLKAQIGTTLNPGTYCVLVTDIGTLTDTVTVVGRILKNEPISISAATPKTETFASNIAAGGSSSRTFFASQSGTVAVTLQSLTPPSSATLAIGVPGLDGTGCNLNTAVKASASSSPQITVPVDISTYCVRLFDSGGLVTAANGFASFTIQIVHP